MFFSFRKNQLTDSMLEWWHYFIEKSLICSAFQYWHWTMVPKLWVSPLRRWGLMEGAQQQYPYPKRPLSYSFSSRHWLTMALWVVICQMLVLSQGLCVSSSEIPEQPPHCRALIWIYLYKSPASLPTQASPPSQPGAPTVSSLLQILSALIK